MDETMNCTFKATESFNRIRVVIEPELGSKVMSVLEEGVLSLSLPPGRSLKEGKKVAKYLNDNIQCLEYLE